jgi:hypothetical protein
MKTSHHTHHSVVTMAATVVVLTLAGASQTFADGPYRHDGNGYWDGNHHYHHYEYYQNHRGYWDERSGVRVFINL